MYGALLILLLTLFAGANSTFARDDIIVSACENEYINIKCTGRKILNIRKAIYCYHQTSECCSSDHTSHIITGYCQNKGRCHFQVNRYLFGDQCSKFANNLTIYYTCENGIPNCSANKCKNYEVWNKTASICPKMCPSQYTPPKNCPVDEACTCIKDYVLDRHTMTCIPEKYCPKSDEKNERFSRCHAESQYCPGPIAHEVSKKCVPGYVCDKSLYRDISGHCIPVEKCPPLKG